MRFPRDVGVIESTSREVLVGLYVRDALGVADPSALPRLLGTGLRDPGPADDRINWWWQRWWIAIIDFDGDNGGYGVVPPRVSELGDEALHRHLDDARTWADVVHEQAAEARLARVQARDTVVSDVIAERRRELGIPTSPFQLRIEILPLTTAGIWWIGENTIAVDELLRDDQSSYALALEPIVDRLLTPPDSDANQLPVGH